MVFEYIRKNVVDGTMVQQVILILYESLISSIYFLREMFPLYQQKAKQHTMKQSASDKQKEKARTTTAKRKTLFSMGRIVLLRVETFYAEEGKRFL